MRDSNSFFYYVEIDHTGFADVTDKRNGTDDDTQYLIGPLVFKSAVDIALTHNAHAGHCNISYI